MKFAPYGLAGGDCAILAQNMLTENGATEQLASKISRWLKKGALVTHVQPGGGGFGPAHERDPERVRNDVWNGKITAAFARDRHGVVVDEAGIAVDPLATRQLRGAHVPA